MKIEILINPQGATTIQTKGYGGGSCKDATKALEEALGIRSSEKLTAEYYQQQNAQATQKLNG